MKIRFHRFRCLPIKNIVSPSFGWFMVLLLFLTGCSFGPSMMRANRLTYNDALQFTERQELLLNIVRLRYNEGPEFLATSSIST